MGEERCGRGISLKTALTRDSYGTVLFRLHEGVVEHYHPFRIKSRGFKALVT